MSCNYEGQKNITAVSQQHPGAHIEPLFKMFRNTVLKKLSVLIPTTTKDSNELHTQQEAPHSNMKGCTQGSSGGPITFSFYFIVKPIRDVKKAKESILVLQ